MVEGGFPWNVGGEIGRLVWNDEFASTVVNNAQSLSPPGSELNGRPCAASDCWLDIARSYSVCRCVEQNLMSLLLGACI